VEQLRRVVAFGRAGTQHRLSDNFTVEETTSWRHTMTAGFHQRRASTNSRRMLGLGEVDAISWT